MKQGPYVIARFNWTTTPGVLRLEMLKRQDVERAYYWVSRSIDKLLEPEPTQDINEAYRWPSRQAAGIWKKRNATRLKLGPLWHVLDLRRLKAPWNWSGEKPARSSRRGSLTASS